MGCAGIDARSAPRRTTYRWWRPGRETRWSRRSSAKGRPACPRRTSKLPVSNGMIRVPRGQRAAGGADRVLAADRAERQAGRGGRRRAGARSLLGGRGGRAHQVRGGAAADGGHAGAGRLGVLRQPRGVPGRLDAGPALEEFAPSARLRACGRGCASCSSTRPARGSCASTSTGRCRSCTRRTSSPSSSAGRPAHGVPFRIQSYGEPPATMSSYRFADLFEGEGWGWTRHPGDAVGVVGREHLRPIGRVGRGVDLGRTRRRSARRRSISRARRTSTSCPE